MKYILWFRYSHSCPWQCICYAENEETATHFMNIEMRNRDRTGWIKGEYKIAKWGVHPNAISEPTPEETSSPGDKSFGFVSKGSGV